MRLQDLNFQHLLYFHMVAREGSVLSASQVLHLAPSTVSSQIKSLEERLGQPLFQRAGRNLVLTSFGEAVRRYTGAIFDTGEELVRLVSHGEVRRAVRVGVSSVLPKLLVRDLLQPGIRPDVQLHIQESAAEDLLAALAARRLDVVLSDAEMPPWMTVRAVSHLLVETKVAIFGSPALAELIGEDLPQGLGRVPWLVPPAGTSLRQGLEAWWEEGIEPDIAAVIDDSALLKAIADQGLGVFAAPERLSRAIMEGYRVVCIGVVSRLTERAYAITRDEDPAEPAVRAICGLDPAQEA